MTTQKDIWYAVMQDREDQDWGTGSHDLDESKAMARDYGGDAYIAVIEITHHETFDEPFCIEEITDLD